MHEPCLCADRGRYSRVRERAIQCDEETALIDRTILRFAIAVMLALAAGYFIPAIFAILDGHYFHDDVVELLDDQTRSEHTIEEQRATELRHQLAVADELIADSVAIDAVGVELEGLVQARDLFQRKLQEQSPRIRVRAFGEQLVTTLWILAYLSFGLLIAFPAKHWSKTPKAKISWRSVAVLFLLLWLIDAFPTWLRATSFGDAGRTIYSCTNLDVSAIGFFRQEANRLLFWILLCVILCRSLSEFEFLRNEREPTNYTAIIGNPKEISLLSSEFFYWQISSIALAVPFVFLLYFYWMSVNKGGDVRYMTAALGSQFLWGLAWLCLSAPMLWRWRRWTAAKTQSLSDLAKGVDLPINKETLDKIDPLSLSRIAASEAAAIALFFGPMIKGIFFQE